MSLRCIFAAIIVAQASLPPTLLGQAPAPDFEKEIAPLLIGRCLECHSTLEKAGGLDLQTNESFSKGGDSGEVIDRAALPSSLLLAHVSAGDMPPPRQGKSQKLPDDEIAIVRRWVEAGAPWPPGRDLDPFETTTKTRAGRDWWSLQPIQRVTPPMVQGAHEIHTPIDAFVLEKIKAAGLAPAGRADARSLIRRVYFDVTGLPPTHDEVEEFARDSSPRAYERLVDRVLSSPQFGERFARHWLDLVRYADTSGYERDQEKPGAWRYRDYVRSSFNEDLPYDRFVIEQLAGDEIEGRDERTVVATGFLRLGTWNDEPNDPEEYKYERLEDQIHATGTAFLGLTVKCARCHDHKFDPIEQSDYYRLASAFWAGPIEARDRELLGGPKKEELGFDVLGWTDVSREAKPLHRLKKGDPHRPEEVVTPATLSFLPTLARDLAPPPDGATTTHRRRQFAEWLANRENPLTSRVIVNWVWTQYFRRGIVASPGNFGFTGAKPSHPEMLDWLANELIESGWSLKHVHRQILLSATYQQSSLHPREEEFAQIDPANAQLWKAGRKRLDAESMRDAMLAVCGDIDLRLGGSGFRPPVAEEALEGLSRKSEAWKVSPASEQLRRSLYLYSQRSLQVPLMATFDASDTTQPCAQREVTTVAPQALAMMNNAFTLERSEALAKRLLNETDVVGAAYLKVLLRQPNEAERRLCELFFANQLQHLQQVESDASAQRLKAISALCHVLLSCNEFIFID
jgi:hypothetical protein